MSNFKLIDKSASAVFKDVIHLAGVHHDGNKYITDATIGYKMDRNNSGMEIVAAVGRSLTPEATHKMIQDYVDAHKDTPDDTLSILFGKEAILQILMQRGCEGIRVYLCKNADKKDSAVLVGVDDESRDLGTTPNGKGTIFKDPDLTNFPMVKEVGNGKTIREHDVRGDEAYLYGLLKLVDISFTQV